MDIILTFIAQAQELQRVRENQQRSRDRKRAHVVELEEKVRHLSERLQRSERGQAAPKLQPSGVATENDARRELLKALGIDDAAQEQFVRAFSRRTAATETALGLKSPVSDRASDWKSTVGSSVPKLSPQDNTDINRSLRLLPALSWSSARRQRRTPTPMLSRYPAASKTAAVELQMQPLPCVTQAVPVVQPQASIAYPKALDWKSV